MRFDFTEEQATIKSTARELLEARGSLAGARAVAEGGQPDPALWAELRELGWPGIAIAEEHGGLGLGVVELCAVLEELGYGLGAVPLLSNALAGLAIATAGSDEQRERWLPGIASGEARGAAGAPELVPDARGAAVIVLLGEEGPVVVAAEDAQLEERPTIDGTRPTARVGAGDGGEPLPGDAGAVRDVVATAVAAELLGLAQRALDGAVAYAKEREQFERPIGAYQAVSHRLAGMLRDVECARSTVYWAAWAAGADPAALPMAAAVAKSQASAGALAVTRSAIQVLGGIGFTWEHDAHLLLKRAHLDAELGGSARAHQDRIAELLAGQLVAS
jgi:alkylation response protein AidB-like acyl-CoA dehydrogenase